ELRQEENKSAFYEVVKRLYKKVAENKKRKFLNTFEDFEKLANSDLKEETPSVLCPSCRSVLIEEGQEVCKWCETFEEVGSFLPRAKYVVFSKDKMKEKGYFLEGFGGFYLTDQPVEGFAYSINSTQMEGVAGFKFFANTVPIGEDRQVMSFEEMVEGEEGYQKLGYVRADVDNLGYIFSEGLRETYSISRIATLSRSLDLFFSGYLNRLFEKEFKNQVYVVYAGGDDLFIIAHWEKALEVVERIHTDFKAYTCQKESFDLSCGVSLADPKHPLRFGAEEAGAEEDKAKERKPAIRVLGETLKWEEFKEAREQAEKFLQHHGDKVGRSMVYKIYSLLKLHMKDGLLNMRFYPLLYYFVNRNIPEDTTRESFLELLLNKKDYSVKNSASFVLKYILMKTRGVS
ncbi:MAG: type III-A CRISPR-associated protein Cas10/Csm1, partial [Aquificaceae bacterium]|nr:type III-A CRISPR-associated protein Cas10/Csm1 [Aquificaceae bacterium]